MPSLTLSATLEGRVSFTRQPSAMSIPPTIFAASASVLSDSSRLAHELQRDAASLRLGFLLLLLQPRHDLDEGAGTVAIVQLILEDSVPGIFARARRARYAEDIGSFGKPAAGTALYRRGADFLIAQHVEQRRKAIDLLLEERLH